MSTTSQVTSFVDLFTDLQNRARDETGVTATENIAKRYINQALQDIHIMFGEKFPWAERRDKLVTQPEYTTGAVTITQGSTTLTGSSTAWNTNNAFNVASMRAGGKLTINGGTDVYEVSSVASDTSATLTSAFVSDDVSAVDYKYFEDEYALASDFLRPIDQQQFSDGHSIDLIGRTEFRRRYPRNHITGRPAVGTIIDLPPSGDTTPVRKIRFHRPPDSTIYSIPYTYVTSNLVVQSDGTAAASLSDDDDEPIVPLRYRGIIVSRALYWWYRDRKDDDRSGEVLQEFNDVMTRIVSDTEIGDRKPQIRPRISAYRRRAARPWSGGRGRYDVNGAFDRMEF